MAKKIKTTVGVYAQFLDPSSWVQIQKQVIGYAHADAWFEEDLYLINGEECEDPDWSTLPPETPIVVLMGTIRYPLGADHEDYDLCKCFRKWLDMQSHRVVAVKIPKERYDDFVIRLPIWAEPL